MAKYVNTQTKDCCSRKKRPVHVQFNNKLVSFHLSSERKRKKKEEVKKEWGRNAEQEVK